MSPFPPNASSNPRETSPICPVSAGGALRPQIWPHLGLGAGDPLQAPSTQVDQATPKTQPETRAKPTPASPRQVRHAAKPGMNRSSRRTPQRQVESGPSDGPGFESPSTQALLTRGQRKPCSPGAGTCPPLPPTTEPAPLPRDHTFLCKRGQQVSPRSAGKLSAARRGRPPRPYSPAAEAEGTAAAQAGSLLSDPGAALPRPGGDKAQVVTSTPPLLSHHNSRKLPQQGIGLPFITTRKQ